MIMKRLRQLACLGVIGLSSAAATTHAQEWYYQPAGWYRAPQNLGYLQGTETTWLYSAEHGWRRLPVVRGGQMPWGYGPPAGTIQNVSGTCGSSGVQWSGYREFWVPLNEVHLYQNDPRFRVVTAIPKEPPVAPVLPPKP